MAKIGERTPRRTAVTWHTPYDSLGRCATQVGERKDGLPPMAPVKSCSVETAMVDQDVIPFCSVEISLRKVSAAEISGRAA
jgi:hypothetical protein